MSSHVIETVTFKLKEGITPEGFTKAAKAVNAYVAGCDGFISRRLSRADDGTWIEHIEWADLDSAKAAAASIGNEPGNAEFLSAINGPTVTMMHSKLEVSVS